MEETVIQLKRKLEQQEQSFPSDREFTLRIVRNEKQRNTHTETHKKNIKNKQTNKNAIKEKITESRL